MGYLSPGQRESLRALADTFCPACEETADAKAWRGAGPLHEHLWKTSAGDLPVLITKLEDAIETVLDSGERLEISLLLTALSTVVGSALLVPVGPYSVAFSRRSYGEREAGLNALSTSMLPPRRKAFNALKRLILGLAASFTDPDAEKEGSGSGTGSAAATAAAATAAAATVSADGMNPFWSAAGYPGPPRRRTLNANDATPATMKAAAAADAALLAGSKAADEFTTKALQITEDSEVEFDVVIVGSGAGGGVAAAELSAAGYSVLVMEKGKYFAPEDITQLEEDAISNMYEKSGLLTSDDGSMAILAGATFGGGTSVNWACCLPPPPFVLAEWKEKHGLAQFVEPQFAEALAAVNKRIGATAEGVVHNGTNTLVLDSCKKLGYKCEVAPQNLKDTGADSAGWTCFGDRYGNKQGTLRTFLADAAAAPGTKFVHECAVQKVLHESSSDGDSSKRVARGVVATVGDPKEGPTFTLTAKAKRCVIVACGSLHSPCLLLRSGFKSDHIGQHLRLHPVTGVVAEYKGKKMEVWSGAPMTTVCKVAEMGPKADGYGAKLEVPSAHLGLMAAYVPWFGGAELKETLVKASETSALIVLQRDSGEGQIRLGPDGFSPKVAYTVCDADKASMQAALKHAVRILAAGSPAKISTLHSERCQFEQKGRVCDGTGTDPAAEAELEEYIARADSLGLHSNSVGIFSAHQMGSNRMGSEPSQSVVDQNGEMWECDGLFLCDASVFPTASGSNPMITTLATAQMLMTRLAKRLQHEDGVAVVGASSASSASSGVGSGVGLQLKERKAQRSGSATKATEKTRMRATLYAVATTAVAAAAVAWVWAATTAAGSEQ